MAMHPNKQKEEFSKAFIRVLAAHAGYKVTEVTVDDDSIDLRIQGYLENGMRRVPELDVQLKCTADDKYADKPEIIFDLKQKNYNDLCDTRKHSVPRLLFVVVVPNDLSNWTQYADGELLMHYSAYWHTLFGQKPIYKTRQRICILRTNVLNSDALKAIMNQIGFHGGLK
jgi:hypothetical protein